jgi:uncharacterized Zn-binding protein involved in type VI secretion
MGTPAARIMDPTAHGGMVTLGYPTVMIGNMPASRIGDMHVCPMVTGVVPHVGGPFILGAFNVLVGMMPQSRVGDMLVCVGPPDTLIMGCPTVMVGMGFSAGILGVVQGLLMAGAAVLQSLVKPAYPVAKANADGTFTTQISSCVSVAGTAEQQANTLTQIAAIRQGPGGNELVDSIDAAGKPVTLNVIGNPADARALHPGQQHYQNCAVQSAQQIIHKATGNDYTESEMENIANNPVSSGYTQNGGTPAGGEEAILENGGVPAHMEPGNTANVDKALENNQGVITGHNAADLWNDPNANGGHDVFVTGAVQDSNGNTLGYVINDTGTGEVGRTVPADQFANSMDGGPIAVTDNPIW